MRTHGCGIAYAIAFLFLSACHSGQSALESQIKEDLNQILNSAAHKQQLAQQLSSVPPASRMLNEAHVQMYVLVKARAAQLRGTLTNGAKIQFAKAPEATPLSTEDHQQVTTPAVAFESSLLEFESEPELSPEEITALNELELNQDLYVWVKNTIDDTLAFIDATTDSEIVDIVTAHDPAIKHNITVVNDSQERLSVANSIAFKVSSLVGKLGTAHNDPFLMKTA